jgi:hypothetical protein
MNPAAMKQAIINSGGTGPDCGASFIPTQQDRELTVPTTILALGARIDVLQRFLFALTGHPDRPFHSRNATWAAEPQSIDWPAMSAELFLWGGNAYLKVNNVEITKAVKVSI